jgi:hypothetical protein
LKRILEKSPVRGYQLFRWQREQADGSTVTLPNYYIRHDGKSTSTGSDRLADAKAAVRKMAGEHAQARRRRSAQPQDVTVGTLLNGNVSDCG